MRVSDVEEAVKELIKEQFEDPDIESKLNDIVSDRIKEEVEGMIDYEEIAEKLLKVDKFVDKLLEAAIKTIGKLKEELVKVKKENQDLRTPRNKNREEEKWRLIKL